MDDEEDNIGWEDDDDDQQIGDDVAWEDDGGDADGNCGGPCPDSPEFEADDDVEEEPEERRWLGDNGEVVVELPREEEEDEEDGHHGEAEDGESNAAGKGKGKSKAAAHRFTAEETRQALSVHKAHLACLVARCAMVSRWAGDPMVQAAMMSCLPSSLLTRKIVPVGQRRLRQGSPSSLPVAGRGGDVAVVAAAMAVARKMTTQDGEEADQSDQEGENDKKRLDKNEGEDEDMQSHGGNLTLADLVVWFREFITVLDDGAVGGGGEGSWGSRPPRLLRVIEQRAGCAQEAVQLFVSVCRGLGLRARYVTCLDPVPPSPAGLLRPSKLVRKNTVDLAAVTTDGRQGRNTPGIRRRDQQQQRRRSRGESGGVQTVALGARSSHAWAEVFCRDGRELYVVADEEGSPSQHPPSSPLPASATSPRPSSKRPRTHGTPSPLPPPESASKRGGGSSSEPLSLSSDDEDNSGGAGAVTEGSGDGGRRPAGEELVQSWTFEKSKMNLSRDGAATAATAVTEGARARPARTGSNRKAAAAAAAAAAVGTTPSNSCKRKRPKMGETAASAAVDAAEKGAEEAGIPKGEGARDSPTDRFRAADPLGGRSCAADGGAIVKGVGGNGGRKRGRRSASGSSSTTITTTGAGETDSGDSRLSAGVVAVRDRWVHVDPIVGAIDQADKVENLRFRKRLMPYVVAEDEKKVMVDVTRRYSTEWARTLRARGRAMARPEGWWNRALARWGASADGRNGPELGGKGTSTSPLIVEGETASAANDVDPRGSEEKELQEKVDNEPVPSTIAALTNHHMYVLGKKLLKFEALRPGAKAVGLVKGSKVYLKTDVATLRGASRWKKDALQVKKSELDKPAKVATKKGEKEGEGTSKLYGDWQTEPWVPEAAVNGKVPKNEYGNVEFFDCSPAFLPPGTVHVRGDQIARVAAKLEVDYAPALTGFDTKQGRQVPVLDGIIVCKEQSQVIRRDSGNAARHGGGACRNLLRPRFRRCVHRRRPSLCHRLRSRWSTSFLGRRRLSRFLREHVGMLLDALTAWQQTLLEKQAKARGQKVLRRWRTLFKGVLLGAQLLEEYGSHD